MVYLVFPEADYTYEPHLLSHFLATCHAAENDSAAGLRQITAMVQISGRNNLWFHYKDVRYKDKEFDTRRLRSLTRGPKAALIDDTGFIRMTGNSFKEINEDHPHGLKYHVQYEVTFSQMPPLLIDFLIHDCETETFLQLAKEFALKHNHPPVLFHNGSGRGWEHRFSGFVRLIQDKGYRHFLTANGFKNRLLSQMADIEPIETRTLNNYSYYILPERKRGPANPTPDLFG